MANTLQCEAVQCAQINLPRSERVDAVHVLHDRRERITFHLNKTVEISELIGVISDLVSSGEERITLILGLLHRLNELNELQFALIHHDDERVREQIERTHLTKYVEFVGRAVQVDPKATPGQTNSLA